MNDLKSKAGVALGAVVLFLWIFGLGMILGGLIAGTFLVIGMMMTIEKIPGFWAFACSRVGKPITVIGTAFLAHLVFGISGPMSMVAVAWSLIFKVMIIEAHSQRLNA